MTTTPTGITPPSLRPYPCGTCGLDIHVGQPARRATTPDGTTVLVHWAGCPGRQRSTADTIETAAAHIGVILVVLAVALAVTR